MGVAHLAALYHNDCQYLAAAIALLPASQPGLEKLLGRMPCFVEQAMQLRGAGRGVLKACVDKQVQVCCCCMMFLYVVAVFFWTVLVHHGVAPFEVSLAKNKAVGGGDPLT